MNKIDFHDILTSDMSFSMNNSASAMRLTITDHGYTTFLKTAFFQRQLDAGKNVYFKSVKFISNKNLIDTNLSTLCQDSKVFMNDSDEYIIMNENYAMSIHISEELTYFSVWGDSKIIDQVISDWSKLCKPYSASPMLEWHYLNCGKHQQETVKLNVENLPCDEMYPFLKNETLTEYYERYQKSNASVLILQGPPGTGKTTFIRGLLSHLNKSAIITYDDNIIQNDSIFMDFIIGDIDYIIFEDADAFLSSRNNDNKTMHRFLNVGDGLVSRPNKKIIFTTNLESIKDIDSALTREGRCFDILQFNRLTRSQADKLINSRNLNFKVENDISIAEIFNSKKYKDLTPEPRKTGFIK